MTPLSSGATAFLLPTPFTPLPVGLVQIRHQH
jgi:hypothetical protein